MQEKRDLCLGKGDEGERGHCIVGIESNRIGEADWSETEKHRNNNAPKPSKRSICVTFDWRSLRSL